jgi:4-amino-4-deoxy-L-arabinose transferase-like glycosyltransferase
VAPLCALAAVPLLLKLEKLLWNEKQEQNSASIWVLFGTLLFAVFVTLTMFDLLLMLCTMAGMIGVVLLSKNERKRGLLWLGAGIGLGVLAKGPVILLLVLPTAVVAPWWAPSLKGRLARWYLDLLLAVLLGAVLALAWALPAAYFGGEAYRHAIFWGQTAGRVSESFAHRAPWWHYLPLLPLILFPWFVWPRFWFGIKEILKSESKNPGFRFLAAWLVLTLIGFSLVSGKQAKYLVPFLPAFALLAGRALTQLRAAPRFWEMLLPAAGFIALPAALAWLRAHPESLRLPDWAGALPLWPLVLLACVAPILLVAGRMETRRQMRALSFAVLASAAVLGAGLLPAFVPHGDPRPAARVLADLEAQRVPVAYFGKYHAIYNFVGRLRTPIDILGEEEVRGWVKAHPGGRVLVVERQRLDAGPATAGGGPEQQLRFRGAWLQLWRGEALLLARPELR